MKGTVLPDWQPASRHRGLMRRLLDFAAALLALAQACVDRVEYWGRLFIMGCVR